MACTQILLQNSRDYDKSWMKAKGADEEEFKQQYVMALYFVTTTLSTCGFGDISAKRGDAVETLAVLLLQFFGMIFYSMSIQKVQSLVNNDNVPASEYANSMQELTDNLVVKVGRQMPIE
jgi:heme/copper-type cytochrome/quinol oxidase subunit 3